MARFSHHDVVPDSMAGYRLDQALAQMFPEHSRSRLTQWLKDGMITVDGGPSKPRAKVQGGEQIDVDATLAVDEVVTAEPVELTVAFEDAAFVVINKPAGLVVHPGAGNQHGTLQHGLLHRWPALAGLPRAGLVHRIDKDTTGLLLVAKTLPAHTALTRALAKRDIHREYLAICHGALTGGGTIDAPIGRHAQDRLRMSVRSDGRDAVTHYRIEERFATNTMVRVTLETGRTHQIRVHFAHQRYPLVGDPLYGGRQRIPPGNDTQLIAALRGFKRQALHATQLTFVHPDSGETVTAQAPLPDDMQALAQVLREHTSRQPA
ncbi:MAG: 23S rRNA pseudouridine(1911/1915/1917) synthase RluD [Pseudomonadota bacterium]